MENRIKYPFKNFVKNIVIGIILILSVFCLMPVMNGANSLSADGTMGGLAYTESGKLLTFNIKKNGDLEKFATIVNNGTLNEYYDKGYKYKAVLKVDNIDYTGQPIGVSSDTGAFKGTFDGNGYTIKTATITPVVEQKEIYYSSIYDNKYNQVTLFGLFGYIENANIENLTVNKIEASKYQFVVKNSKERVTECITVDDNGYTDILVASKDSKIGGIVGYAKNSKLSQINLKSYSIKLSVGCYYWLFNGTYMGSYSGNLNFGGLVGYMEASSVIDSCKVSVDVSYTSINYLNSSVSKNKRGFESGTGEINLGGAVGYCNSSDIKNTDVIKYNIKSTNGWAPHNNSYINAGGLVGNFSGSDSNTTLYKVTNCYVLNGTQDFSGLYFGKADDTYIGGLIGSASNGIIENCITENKINIDECEGVVLHNSYTEHSSTDYLVVGGVIGRTYGKYLQVSECCCEWDDGGTSTTDRILIATGIIGTYKNFFGTLKYSNPYRVVFGGVVGYSTATTLTVKYSYLFSKCSIQMGDEDAKNDQQYLGYYVGIADGGAISLSYCYFIVTKSETLNEDSYSTYGMNISLVNTTNTINNSNLSKNISETTVDYQKCYYADGAFKGTFDDKNGGLYTNLNISSYVCDLNTMSSYKSADNAKISSLLSISYYSYNNSISWFGSSMIYGYNSKVQTGGVSTGVAGPFLLGKTGYSKYVNILIDFTKLDDDLSTTLTDSNVKDGSGFTYTTTTNNKTKIIYNYGTAVYYDYYNYDLENYCPTTGYYAYTFPEISYGTYSNKKVAYYSLYSDGHDKNGNMSIFALPGEKIIYENGSWMIEGRSTEFTNTSSYRVYPIFRDSYTIYTTTRMETVSGAYTATDKTHMGDGVYTWAVKKNGSVVFDIIETPVDCCEVTAEGTDKYDLYAWKYEIYRVASTGKALETSVIKELLTPEYTDNNGKTLSDLGFNYVISDSPITTYSGIGSNYYIPSSNYDHDEIKNNEFIIDYTNNKYSTLYTLFENLNQIIETEYDVSTGGTAYFNIYKYIKFYSGQLETGADGNYIISEGGIYAGEYTETDMKVSAYTSYKSVPFFLGGLKDDDARTNANGKKTIKTWTAKFSNVSNFGVSDIVVTKDGKDSIIYSLKTDSISLDPSRTTFTGEDGKTYQSLGIYDKSSKDSIYQNDVLANTTSNIINIYTVYESPALFIRYHNYDSSIVNSERIAYQKNGSRAITDYKVDIKTYYKMFKTHEIYFIGWEYKYYNINNVKTTAFIACGEITINIPSSYITNNTTCYIDLYPVFMETDKNAYVSDSSEIQLSEDYQDKINSGIEEITIDSNTLYISSAEDLVFASYLVNIYDKTDLNIVLKNSIDMSSINDFLPIGMFSAFKGTFNGNGYSIFNLKIIGRANANKIFLTTDDVSGSTLLYVGLFGKTYGATIQSVNLINEQIGYNELNAIEVETQDVYVGGVVGYSNSSKIKQVLVEGKFYKVSSSSATSYMGGLVGGYYNTEFNECVTSYTGEATYIGSMAGYCENKTEISDDDSFGNYMMSEFSNCFDTDCSLVGFMMSSFVGSFYVVVGGFYLWQYNNYGYTVDFYIWRSGNCYTNNYVSSKNCGVYYAYENNIPFNMSFTETNEDGQLIWAQDDNVNGGLPYLLNTGIVYARYQIDASKYILTEYDKQSLENNYGIINSGDVYYVIKPYSLLDILSYIENSRTSITELYKTDSIGGYAARESELLKCYAWDISLTIPYPELEGYNWNSYTYVNGTLGNMEDMNKNAGFVASLLHLQNKANLEVFLDFSPRIIDVQYVIKFKDGSTYYVDDNKSSNFAENYICEQIDFNSLTDAELKEKIKAYEVESFKLYLPEKGIYLDINELNSYLIEAENGALSFKIGTEFILSEIDTYPYNLYLVISEEDGGLKPIEYKLNFFADEIDGDYENSEYNAIVEISRTNHEYEIDYENGNINYIIKNFNNELSYENGEDVISLLPSIYQKTGYTFMGWGYYPENDKTKTLTKFTSSTMPELRDSPYLAEIKDDDGTYFLNLYPILEINKYDLNYYDGFESVENPTYITNQNPQPKFTDFISLYGVNEFQKYSTYNTHEGYSLVGFKFKNSTVSRLTNLNDVDKSTLMSLIELIFEEYDLSLKEIADVDEITYDNYISICENLVNYFFIMNIEMPYFMPVNVDLVCIYERVDMKVEIVLPVPEEYNKIYDSREDVPDLSAKVSMNYEIIDGVSGELKETGIVDFTDYEIVMNDSFEYEINPVTFVKSISYNDIFIIYTNLLNGARIEKISVKGGGNIEKLTYNHSSISNKTTFINEDLPNLSKLQLGKIEGSEIVGIKDKVVCTIDIKDYNISATTLISDSDGYYCINNEQDLVEYANHIVNYKKAKLTNNINITGLKIEISSIPYGYILDGDSFTINGFTDFNSEGMHYFINENYGSILNLNFDNICVNINAKTPEFALINQNYGKIDGCNILDGQIIVASNKDVDKSTMLTKDILNVDVAVAGFVLMNNKYAIISNSSCNLSIQVSGLSAVAMIAVYNAGEINCVSTCANIDCDTNNSYISLITNYQFSYSNKQNYGNINNVIIEENSSINTANATNINLSSIANIIVGENLNITNIADFSSIDISMIDSKYKSKLPGSVYKITSSINLKDLLNAKFKTSAFKIVTDFESKTEQLVLPNVNIQLIEILVTNNLGHNNISFNEKINNVEISDSVKTYAQKLNNKLSFNSINSSILSTNQYVLDVFYDGSNINDKLLITNQIDGGIKTNSNNASIVSSRKAQTNELNFEYKANNYSNFSLTLTYKKGVSFTAEEKELIEKNIKIMVNNQPLDFVFEDGIAQTENGEYLTLNYFDKVDINFNLLSFAFISTNGVKLNSKLITNSKYQSQYSIQSILGISNTIDSQTFNLQNEATFVAEIDRKAVKLVFDLNLNSLTDSTEKAKIKFNTTQIQNILNDNGFASQINNSGELEVEVNPTIVADNTYYYLPEISMTIDGALKSIFDYENNGINYEFQGFAQDINGGYIYYYNKDFTIAKQHFENSLILKAQYNKVCYTIEIQSEKSINSDIVLKNNNGYKITSNGKIEKQIYFSDNMSVPTIEKVNYNDCYTFVGYKLKNGTMISSASFSGTNIIHTFASNYTKLNANYTKNKESNEFRIVLIPVFEENDIVLTFKDGQNSNDYDAYLYFNANKEEHFDTTQLTLTISQILTNNFVLPLAEKEHHKFVGYKLEENLSDNLDIIYSNDNFVYDKNLLTKSSTFIAFFEIDKVNITIEMTDYAKNRPLDYNIESLNDVETKANNYEILTSENKIVFEVDFNTTNFVLPQIKLTNTDYKFSSYQIVGGETYSLSYKFTSNETIQINCLYKVVYQTKTGTITANYKITQSMQNFGLNEDLISYSFYAPINQTIILPTNGDETNLEVLREGCTLAGYKKDGVKLDFDTLVATTFVVSDKTEIEFLYELETKTLTLDVSNYDCSLPTSFISAYIESYDLDETNNQIAYIKVVYGTKVSNIKNSMFTLENDGYTFAGYSFSEGNEDDTFITKDGTINAIFVQNQYNLIVYNADGSQISTITKHYNETIDSSFYENIETIANNTATANNSLFRGLSLSKSSYISFKNKQTNAYPTSMPRLEKEYSEVEHSENSNIYTLKLYCSYLSDVQITIKAKENSKIENINTVGISNFSGGNDYNASATFMLSGDAIISGTQIILPIPQIKEDSELTFAIFKGYSMLIDGIQTLIVSNDGTLLDEFLFTDIVELTQEFEYNSYNFTLNAQTNTIKDNSLFDFEQNDKTLTKQIKFNEEIGSLPVPELENYNFVGYYFSQGNDLLVESFDVQIADENGILLEDYIKLNKNFFNKTGTEYQLKNIYAKYEIKLISVKITTNNSNLGSVSPITLANGTSLSYQQIENGYEVFVPSGNDVIIVCNVNELVATFKNWQVNLGEEDVTTSINIDNFESSSTIIRNITNSLDICAYFDYITFTITYIIDGENQDLSPIEFNIDTEEFTLPLFEKYGYDFAGWFLEENFINKREVINPKNYANDIVLYGKLENKQVKISIYSNNIEGYTLYGQINAKYNTQIEILPTIVLNGYNFVGYFTKTNAQGIKITNESLSIFVEDLNVYAYFEKIKENTLQGEGTENNPYQIKTKEDFKLFAQISNTQNTQNMFFKLTNSIEIDEQIIINSFSGNFNGDGYCIYLNNALIGHNNLTFDGKVVKNISLFGENNGIIKNLILTINQTEISDVLNANEISQEIYHINLSTYANKNNGEILNVVVYFKISAENIDFESTNNSFSSICFENKNITDHSVLNSTLTHKTNIVITENVLNKHLHNQNVQNISKNASGNYEVSSAEEFAYLLSTNFDEQINIVLKNNIDFKGKILEKTNNNISIFANGYILSNMIVLNQNNMFENLALNKTAIENLVSINLFNTHNFIQNANGIKNSYIEVSVSNFENLISTNNEDVENSYFITQTNTKLVEINNANLKNSYIIGFNETENSSTNFVKFNLTNLEVESVDTFIEKAKEINSANSIESLWFKDEEFIMSDYVLPKLIGVGNIVTAIIYDSNNIEITLFNANIVNNNLIISKENQEIIINLLVLNNQINISNILLNGQSEFGNYNSITKLYTSSKTSQNQNEIEIITDLNNYEVLIEVDNKNLSNTIQINETKAQSHTLFVASGTKISELNIQPIAITGYKFVGYEVYNNLGEKLVDADPQILSNTTIKAIFEKLVEYNLNLSSQTNIVVTDNKIDDYWTETSENNFVIYLATSENVEEYLPTITKQDYVFVSYQILKLSELEYKILPVFEADYITVSLDYVQIFGTATLQAESEYSLTSPELKIVEQQSDKVYKILRGYDVNLIIIFNGTYLTKLTLNSEDLFEDYSQFVEKDDEIEKLIHFDETLNEHTIEIVFADIMIETKFVFNTDFVSLELQNAIMNLNEFVVSTRKNFEIMFELNIDASKELESITFANDSGEISPKFENFNEVYYYTASENATITINLKNKMLLVSISYTEGGKAEVNSNLETTEIDEKSFSFSLDFSGNFDLTLTAFEGYKPKEILVNNKKVSLQKLTEFKDVVENQTIEVKFEKLSTWLDLDENNSPKYFNLVEFKGKGTEINPYKISSFNDFLTLVYNINVLGKDYTGIYFKSSKRDLIIDLSNHYFTPIESFNGTILGDNLTLSGIKIYADTNSALIKTLNAQGTIKAINISGKIEGNFCVAGLVSINNGQIFGCSNSAEIINSNNMFDENNIVSGICAVNNGTISRTYNSGDINSNAVKTAGICAVNNGIIDNIYNTGKILAKNNFEENSFVAGICSENKNIIQIGYNNSRVVNQNSNQNIILSGTVINNGGAYQNIYFNSNKLSLTSSDARSFSELCDETNALYENFDFTLIWEIAKNKSEPAKLKICYEYLANLTFTITFDENLTSDEKLVLAEIISETGENYGLIIQSENRIYTIKNLTKGVYEIRLKSLLSGIVTMNEDLKIELNEEKGENINIQITLTKGEINGYYGFVIV